MKIRLRENGSLVLDLPEGAKFVLNGQEQVLERAKLALCRCGHSENKPFCDGHHKRVGFVAPGGEMELLQGQPENSSR
ncbi:CDGSH iron-sulfur domain-containing protein [uncultured Meiothermus sp.]|jgi:CDGSH-type Zn-finger protein|uniref:CDGSH iron-sulfur domain-containing protein n=1 Tax=uncultured Meiothermus sp. TaxID=157471 RepID=UPI002614A8BF|nr:CDGSH iron-sulfur domain-containing protein [uncultured Meiothermus sp.]